MLLFPRRGPVDGFGHDLADVLVGEDRVGLVSGKNLKDLLSQVPPPNRASYDLATAELLKWFPA